MIQFKNYGDPIITYAELESFEGFIEAKLPSDYKLFMKNNNGGFPVGDNVYFDPYQDEDILLESLHALRTSNEVQELKRINKGFKLLSKGVDIGNISGGGLAMSLSSNDYGAIYAFYSDTDPFKIASSFTGFIEGLVDYGPEED